MLGSTSIFFQQTPLSLRKKRSDIATLLEIKGYSQNETAVYLKAYDYFCNRTMEFDGATIVKDLCDIPGLDLDAMLHDYHYIAYNAGASYYTKFLADWIYAKGNERKGKGSYSAFSRFAALSIVGLGFVPYAYFVRGNNTFNQEKNIDNDYKILIK